MLIKRVPVWQSIAFEAIDAEARVDRSIGWLVHVVDDFVYKLFFFAVILVAVVIIIFSILLVLFLHF